jgi:hypothetical protein
MNEQAKIEALYSKRQIHTVLHEAIRHELDGFLLNWSLRTWYAIENYLEGDYYDSKNERIKTLKTLIEKKGIEFLLIKIMAAVIHTSNQQTYQQVIGYVQAFLLDEDPFDRARTAGELIALGASKTGMYSIKPRKGKMSLIKVNHWKLVNQHLLNSLDWINSTCFNPPLVERPLTVTSNEDAGYHTITEHVLLGTLAQHDKPQCLDALNALNEIEWVIDPYVLKEPELPSNSLPDKQSKDNFVQMVSESQFIYKMLGQEPFWFIWQYDSRGRIYSHGYHVNFQSAEYKKALLNFNHYEELTSENHIRRTMVS